MVCADDYEDMKTILAMIQDAALEDGGEFDYHPEEIVDMLAKVAGEGFVQAYKFVPPEWTKIDISSVQHLDDICFYWTESGKKLVAEFRSKHA
jgi:hypothetical protein